MLAGFGRGFGRLGSLVTVGRVRERPLRVFDVVRATEKSKIGELSMENRGAMAAFGDAFFNGSYVKR